MLKSLKKSIPFVLYFIGTIGFLSYLSVAYWQPIGSNEYYILLAYFLMAILINSLPLKIGHIYVTFGLVVSIAVFLRFGVIVEAWLTSMSFLISMLLSVDRRSIVRMFLTTMMFIWISLISGYSYYLVGGEIGYELGDIVSHILPILFYTFSYFWVNHIMIYFSRRIFLKQKAPFTYTEDMLWDAITLLLTLPLGVIMYFGEKTHGFNGIIVVAIPIFIISHMFKLYNELKQSHIQLSSLNKISASFTAELNLERAISSLQQAIREILSFEHSYIFQKEGNELNLISAETFDGTPLNIRQENNHFKIKLGDGLTGRVALMKKGKIVGSDIEIYELDVEPDYVKNNHSLLSVPILWNDEVIGVITLGSPNEHQFTKKDMTLAKILASQAAVAIKNAITYKESEKKSKTDELTGIYNYRAFDELLAKKLEEAEQKEENLSLIIVDLDHFKQVNDQFGHLVGNEVLKTIATLLKKYTRKNDVVARYGGEEFTLIITNSDKYQAEEIAERIRDAIQHHRFVVNHSISGKGEVLLNITASIGIASYPEMASTGKDLVRHADLAMYIGSKQGGRNKVSIYDAG